MQGLCVLCLLASSFNACSSSDDSEEKASDKKEKVTITKTPVEVELIRSGDVVDVVAATGTAFPLHDVLISSESAGKITEVRFEVGDHVGKGELLLQIDPELKQLAVDQAQAALLQAKAALDKMTKDFERNKELFAGKDISEYVFESARLQKDSAKAAYLTAQANYKMAKRQLSDAGIKSPVSGYLAARLVELGATVAPGLPVAKVVDISKIKVKFGVSEKDIAKIEAGQVVEVAFPAFPSENFHGLVSAVGPQADLATRSFPVEVLLENASGQVKAGMIAKVSIATRTLKGVPLLPKKALLVRSGQNIFFVALNGKAEKRTAELGLEQGDSITLRAGGSSGEFVVVMGQENLTEGSTIVVHR